MHERLKQLGALSSTVAALGMAAVEAPNVQASPNQPEGIAGVESTQDMAYHPEGIKSLLNPQAIEAERKVAFKLMHKRWNGVLVLHEPKKNASICYADSPRAYSSAVGTEYFTPGFDKMQVAIQPALVKYKGRLYASAADINVDYKFGFLDVKWAMDNGALDLYEFTDSKPRSLNYNPNFEGETSGTLPMTTVQFQIPPKQLLRMTFPDRFNKLHHIKRSKTVPHL